MVSPFSHGVNISPILDIAHRVAEKGHKVHFYTVKTSYIEFRADDSLEMARVPDNVHMHYINNYFFIPSVAFPFLNPFTEYRDLRRIIENEDIDVVHFNFPEHLICLPLLGNLGVPTVLSVNAIPGYDWFYGNRLVDWVGKIYSRHISTRIIQNSDVVVAPSSKLQDTLQALDVDVNLTTLSTYGGCYGVDTQLFLPADPELRDKIRNQYQLPPQAFIIVYAGRFVPIKRIDLLIKSFPSLKRKLKNAHLLLVGDGPQKSELEKLAQDDPDITFIGFLNQEELARIYGACDLFALLSSGEGNAVGVMEACASGLPALVSPVGATEDIVKDGVNGYVINPQKEEIVEKIIQIHNHHEYLARRAREVAEENFSWDYIIKKHLELYHSLVEEGS